MKTPNLKMWAFVLLVGVASVALSAVQYTRILNLRVAGLALLGNNSDSNAIDNSQVVDVDYDFASGTIICTDTPATTATGVKAGDPCFVGIGPRDGGTQIVTANSVFSCFSDAVDTVKLRHCPVGTAANPVDAGYTLRIISSP